MKVLYLYSRVMPYTIAGLQALLKIYRCEIHLIHYKISPGAPYKLPNIKGITYYEESEINKEEIKSLVNDLSPKFIFITGWSNKKYLQIAKWAKKDGIPVISGCDTQWRGDYRQIIAVVFSKFLIRKYFDYLMVAGSAQYEYARLLGFERNHILQPLYAANISLFNKKYDDFLSLKNNNYSRNILFVGRFEKIKGIEHLVKAFRSITDKKGWTLTLIGNGSLKQTIMEQTETSSEIIVKDFLQPEALAEEIKNAGAFCLPSIYEPWGVVLHEFASAGLPILASNMCGASTVFVKENYNGFLFEANNTNQLKDKINLLLNLSNKELLLYSERSNLLAQIVKPEVYAANFLQFFKK